MKIRIGTRKSPMAMVQTMKTQEALKRAFPGDEFEIVKISAEGDKRQDMQLKEFGTKGAFVKEIEDALLSGRIDMAVHSAKDIPPELPKGLEIGAAIERDYAADVLVSTVERMPERPVIGTGSARRCAQLQELYPDAVTAGVRGNIGTRVQKLRDGEFDALMLAEASVCRMGLDKEKGLYFKRFDPEKFIPAAGQGIIAVEVRRGEMKKYLSAINDRCSMKALSIEREFSRSTLGGCHEPSGAYAYGALGGKGVMCAVLYKNGYSARVRIEDRFEALSGEKAAAECMRQIKEKVS